MSNIEELINLSVIIAFENLNNLSTNGKYLFITVELLGVAFLCLLYIFWLLI